MSKFSNILKIIILLKNRGKMKAKELARELEVSEREIRKYKEDLEMAGVFVESIPGINGGYILQGYDYLLNLNISEDEAVALELSLEQLKNADFIYYKEFESLFNKLSVIRKEKIPYLHSGEYFVKGFKSIDINDEKRKCLDIHRAIINKRKIEIFYYSLNSKTLSQRIIHPLAIMTYKGALYMVAFCEKRNEVRDFKVSRIKNYKTLECRFILPEGFSLKEYMKNSIGIYKGEKLKVKLKIYSPMSYIITEKIWVEDQKITWYSDESIIFEAEIKGETELINWILSMGSNVEVLEPESLVIDIKKEMHKMINRY